MLAGKSDQRLAEVKQPLANQFQVKDMGELHYFLGVKVVQDKESSDVWIGQPTSVLQKYVMENVKSASTKLMKAKEDEECVDQQRYQSAVGSLLYLSNSTRPASSEQRGKVLC